MYLVTLLHNLFNPFFPHSLCYHLINTTNTKSEHEKKLKRSKPKQKGLRVNLCINDYICDVVAAVGLLLCTSSLPNLPRHFTSPLIKHGPLFAHHSPTKTIMIRQNLNDLVN